MTEINAVLKLAHARGDGAKVDRSADAAELAAIAERFGFASVASFSVTAALSRLPEGDVYRLVGAAVMQAERVCVVALETFEETTESAFDEYFTTNPDKAADDGPIDAESVDVELLEAELIDVGELALQHVAMDLDPHPRGPDAAAIEVERTSGTPGGGPPDEAGGRRPFAGLDRLLKDAKPKD